MLPWRPSQFRVPAARWCRFRRQVRSGAPEYRHPPQPQTQPWTQPRTLVHPLTTRVDPKNPTWTDAPGPNSMSPPNRQPPTLPRRNRTPPPLRSAHRPPSSSPPRMLPNRHERRCQECPSFPYFCGAARESHDAEARQNDREAVIIGMLPIDNEEPNTNSQIALRDRQLPPHPTTGHRVCVEIAFRGVFVIWTQSRRGLQHVTGRDQPTR